MNMENYFIHNYGSVQFLSAVYSRNKSLEDNFSRMWQYIRSPFVWFELSFEKKGFIFPTKIKNLIFQKTQNDIVQKTITTDIWDCSASYSRESIGIMVHSHELPWMCWIAHYVYTISLPLPWLIQTIAVLAVKSKIMDNMFYSSRFLVVSMAILFISLYGCASLWPIYFWLDPYPFLESTHL